MDQQPGIGAARRDLVGDLLERELAVREVAEHEAQTRNAVVIAPGTTTSCRAEPSSGSRLAADENGP